QDFLLCDGQILEGRTMTSANDPHPSLSELTAFVHGLLAPAERTAVEAHLMGCAECRGRLEALPEDTLASRPRSSVDSANTGPPDNATSLAVASSADAVAPMPPELADHPRYRLLGVIGSGGMGTV